MIFAEENGNEGHLREGRVRLQRRRCSLGVWLTEDLGSFKRDDEKDAEISRFPSLLALHIQKHTQKKNICFVADCFCKMLKGLLWVGWGQSASPAKYEVMIVQGAQQSLQGTVLFVYLDFVTLLVELSGIFLYFVRSFCGHNVVE